MIQDITSPQNALVKLARALERKKARAETGLFLAEGARHVTEGLDLGWRLEGLLFSGEGAGRAQVAGLAERAAAAGARVARVSEKLLETVTRRDNAQAVVGLFHQRWAEPDALAGAATVVALERPRDPGNLGTVLRTLDSTGGGGLILVEQACDPFSSEAVRASMGSVFSVPMARTTLQGLLDWRARHGFQLVGTHLQGSQRHTATAFGPRTCLFMGNEQSGLPEEAAAACDALVRLPMAGRADSLNLAIATAVTLYEIWRQREFHGARF